LSNLDTSTHQLLETYKSAVWARDADAFMRLYDPKVRVFDTWGIWSYEGAAAWRTAIEGWFASLGSEKVKVTFDDVDVLGGGEFRSLSAIVTYAAVSAQGEPLRAMQNRLTWALRTSGHVLRVVHEHTSAPIGFDDQKAILLKGEGK
jgi:ketosteroid isomerase-like protein